MFALIAGEFAQASSRGRARGYLHAFLAVFAHAARPGCLSGAAPDPGPAKEGTRWLWTTIRAAQNI